MKMELHDAPSQLLTRLVCCLFLGSACPMRGAGPLLRPSNTCSPGLLPRRLLYVTQVTEVRAPSQKICLHVTITKRRLLIVLKIKASIESLYLIILFFFFFFYFFNNIHPMFKNMIMRKNARSSNEICMLIG